MKNKIVIQGVVQGFGDKPLTSFKKGDRQLISFTLKNRDKIYINCVAYDKVAQSVVDINRDKFVEIEGELNTNPKNNYNLQILIKNIIETTPAEPKVEENPFE
jgi:aspartyl/asparaginyl-tRNA synthetase